MYFAEPGVKTFCTRHHNPSASPLIHIVTIVQLNSQVSHSTERHIPGGGGGGLDANYPPN